jgi:hypothetical protein
VYIAVAVHRPLATAVAVACGFSERVATANVGVKRWAQHLKRYKTLVTRHGLAKARLLTFMVSRHEHERLYNKLSHVITKPPILSELKTLWKHAYGSEVLLTFRSAAVATCTISFNIKLL